MAKMIDLEYDDEDMAGVPMPFDLKVKRHYPYNTRISFTDKEMRKMKVDASDYDVGDLIDMRAFGEITSIRKDENGCCIEIQIQRVAVENEDQESLGDMNDEEEKD